MVGYLKENKMKQVAFAWRYSIFCTADSDMGS